jgi:hypothetical protein
MNQLELHCVTAILRERNKLIPDATKNLIDYVVIPYSGMEKDPIASMIQSFL